MKIFAIIQARLGSSRLPGKVLLALEGKTVLERVIERTLASKLIDETLVATTMNKCDLNIVKLCAGINTRVFCGSENDVLDRYYQLAKLIDADHVVRITADCPLLDYKLIDFVIKKHLDEKADYTSNSSIKFNNGYPSGLDISVFTFLTLKKTWEYSKLPSEREHVIPFMEKSNFFKLSRVCNTENLFFKRWTLDYPEDYVFIKKLYRGCFEKNMLF